MPLDSLPGVITVPERDDIIEQFKTDFTFYAPDGTSTEDGTLPDVDARTTADVVIPIYNAAKVAGDNLVLTEAQGDALVTWAVSKGLEGRLPAIGATGFLVAGSGFAISGSTILAKDGLTYKGIRYEVSATGLYKQGALIPIDGVDVGLGTDQPAGTVLTWTSPRPGCEAASAVWTAADGSGLTGGRDLESDEDLLSRILTAGREPAASGNDAQYQRTAEATPGVPIEKAFTYPAILGPGTVGLTFTVRRDTPTTSRLPNAAELAAVEAYVKGQMPADDGLFVCALVHDNINVALRVDWRAGVSGWTDATPWPQWVGIGSQMLVTASTNALVFAVNGGGGAPVVGNTVAIYDPITATFYRKRILSFTGSGPWTITCDGAANASDTSFVPVVGCILCPWSDAINAVVTPVLDYFAELGPGEQSSFLGDPGARQRRSPASPGDWPSPVGNRIITDVQGAAEVFDATLVQPDPSTLPVAANIGTPGVVSYLNHLSNLAVYPLST